MLTHLGLRLRIFLFFALMAIGGTCLTWAGLGYGFWRLAEAEALSAFLTAGIIATLAIFGLSVWIWSLFDEHIARPIEQLAAEMRTRAHTDVGTDIDGTHARFLGDLAPAAAAVAANYSAAKAAAAHAVAQETARLNLEKSRLEAVLAEVPDAVLFCSADHSVVLYNGHAPEILGDQTGLGLNRPLSSILRMGPVHQAYDRLAASQSTDGADILCTTKKGATLLEARMRLMWLKGQEDKAPGYAITLRNVTETVRIQGERAHLLNALLEGVETALTNLPPDDPTVIKLRNLTQGTADQKRVTDTQWWPMETLRAADIGAALKVRLAKRQITLASNIEDIDVRCDGFAITRLIERVARSWAHEGGADFELTIERTHSQTARVGLQATGSLPDQTMLDDWLSAPLSPGLAQFSGKDVLVTHASSMRAVQMPGPKSSIDLTLPLASSRPSTPPRRIAYDFELLNQDLPAELLDCALSSLSFVVFDTETTGLNPDQDEICQIAAVRIVNGRLLLEERFDLLVDPGRSIPAGSTAVHGITNDMVVGAPSVTEAVRRFHGFAEGSILVAHNAVFDMAFLKRREKEIEHHFDQPILDTVLCSAIVFGQSAEHTLDAMCKRLNVTIPEADRHTAIGDAIGTAEVFRKMIPMLKAANLPTLTATIKAFDKHARLIGHLN
jgi:DNA polymerase-3 subunit epsilon